MRTTRCGTQSTMQSMSVILGRWHRLLHVRALLAKRNGGEQEICPIHNGSPLDSNYFFKKGRPHGHRYGKKPGDHEYFIANSLKKKCKKRNFLGIHDRFIRDEKFRKNMFDVGRNEEICREMDKLANEDHTHHITPKEIKCIETIGGFVRTQLVLIRCQFGIDLTSSKHCQPCDSSKPRGYSLSAKMAKLFLILVELARILVAFFF